MNNILLYLILVYILMIERYGEKRILKFRNSGYSCKQVKITNVEIQTNSYQNRF